MSKWVTNWSSCMGLHTEKGLMMLNSYGAQSKNRNLCRFQGISCIMYPEACASTMVHKMHSVSITGSVF